MLIKAGVIGVLLGTLCWPCTILPERRVWSKDPTSTSSLFAFEQDGMVGFIDPSGSSVIPPKIQANIEFVGDFHDGLALVQYGEGAGYVNESGELAIAKDQFGPRPILLPFSEGLGTALHDSKTSYVDRKGTVVFELPGSGGREFHEGLAVYRAEPKQPAVDRNSPIPPPPPSGRGIGAEGYIDKQGSLVIEPRFASAGPFVDGLARVVQDGQCFQLTPDGRHLGTPSTGTHDSCGGSPRSVAAICPVGFIDKSGAFVIQPQFDSALDFSEGLAAVRTGGQWGFIDRSGTMVIQPRFYRAGQFREGRAAVLTGVQWGFIDASGEVVLRPAWDEVGEFSEGLAAVSKDGKYSYVDRVGAVAIPGPYLEATRFVHGLAAVRVEKDRVAYINKHGEVVFEYSRRSQ